MVLVCNCTTKSLKNLPLSVMPCLCLVLLFPSGDVLEDGMFPFSVAFSLLLGADTLTPGEFWQEDTEFQLRF